jgi:hypothetical protein
MTKAAAMIAKREGLGNVMAEGANAAKHFGILNGDDREGSGIPAYIRGS